MEPDRHNQVSDIYHAALQRPVDDRAAFLQEACNGDEVLRQEVESLLQYESASSRFLETTAAGIAGALASTSGGTAMVGRQLGPYTIVAPLGVGGMGEVYRARDSKLGRDVAVKILAPHFTADPERRARFAREARLLATLNHPHIGAIYGLEEADGVTALVLELVEGPTLADRLDRKPLPIEVALTVARQIAAALEAAHEKGIIHRDLKPANIVLQGGVDSAVASSGVCAKILDFGLAKSFATGSDDLTLASRDSLGRTAEGRILGTAAYMSPEQARGQAVDKRTDIWAFGCVVYEMYTGRAAFSGESFSDTIAAVLERAPDWSRLPDAVAPNIRRCLVRCLEKDPKRRARDIGDVSYELEPPDLASVAPVSGGRTTAGRRLLWIVAAAAVVTVTSVASVVLARRWPVPNIHVVRFTVAPPPNVGFSPGAVEIPAVQLAISPDGRSIAFVAAPAGGRSMIWVRKLHEIDAKVIPGAVEASYPFWSPDGRHIAYFSAGKLMRVDLSGGQPQVLAEARDGGGGAWSTSGQILFGAAGSEALYQVSESGGSPTKVTTVDRGRRETAHRWPQFLPDGQHFLFLITSENAEVRGIYQGSLDGAPPRFLVPSSLHGIFARPAHLLFVRDGDLVTQSVTKNPPGVSGVVSTLVRNVGGTSSGYGSYSVSDTGVLVHAEPFNPERELVWFTRSGQRLERADGPSDYVDFRLAADGRIAIARNLRDLRTSDIFVVDPRRGSEHRLTVHPALDASPVWSPDLTRLVFRSKRRDAEIDNPSDLYEVSTDGSGSQRLLLSSPVGKYPTDWSPDARTVVYHTTNTQSGWDVWMLSLGEDPTPTALIATGANEMQARFSPDGRWVAYTSDASGRPEVYVKAYPPDARSWQVSTGGGAQPLWTRDGRELLFLAPDGMLMVASVDTGSQFGIDRIRSQFRIPAPGFSPPYSSNYALSADGKRVLVNAVRRDGGLPAMEVILNWPAQLAVGQ